MDEADVKPPEPEQKSEQLLLVVGLSKADYVPDPSSGAKLDFRKICFVTLSEFRLRFARRKDHCGFRALLLAEYESALERREILDVWAENQGIGIRYILPLYGEDRSGTAEQNEWIRTTLHRMVAEAERARPYTPPKSTGPSRFLIDINKFRTRKNKGDEAVRYDSTDEDDGSGSDPQEEPG